MPRRTLFVLLVDSAMLALVCVLECLDLTGLELHEWLGFALCPLVLVHVIWQWPWFAAQFGKLRRAPGARVRINALLNALLLVLMSAVLLSGVFNSRQVISLVGERFGSVRVWREMHNWLNFTLLVWVALHLGLNWDWVLGVLTRRHRDRPVAAEPAPPLGAQSGPGQSLHGRIGAQKRTKSHGLAVVAAVIISAGIAYFVMDALLAFPEDGPEPQATGRAESQRASALTRLEPRPRPILLRHGFEQLRVTSGLVLAVALLGRYAFRLRL